VSTQLYTVAMPGRLYQALEDWDTFCNSDPTDRAARTVFEKAERVKSGNGYRYVLTGERQVVQYVLDYLSSLLDLMAAGMRTFREYSTNRPELTKVISQELVPVQP
jgi:hypothetical protein